MSYPVNVPVTYACLPRTPGYQTSDHTVAWALGDGSTSTILSFSKTWTTTGSKSAQVTATNPFTGGVATENKTIIVEAYDWQSYGIAAPIRFYCPLSAQLDSGTIILAGGGIGSGKIKSTYLFDGSTFTQVGDMNYARSNYNNNGQCIEMAVLADGRVWIVGSNNADSTAASTAEIYDSETETWGVDSAWRDFVISSIPEEYLLNGSKAIGCKPVPTSDGGVVVYGGQRDDASWNGYCIKYRPGVGLIAWTNIINTHLNEDTSITSYADIDPVLALMSDGRIFTAATGQDPRTHNLYDFHIIDVSGATAITHSEDPYPPDHAQRVISVTPLPDLPGVTGGGTDAGMAIIQGQDGDLYVFGIQYNTGNLRSFAYRMATNTWEELAISAYILNSTYASLLADRYIMLSGVTLSGGVGSVLFDIVAKEWIMPRLFAQVGSLSPGEARYSGHGLLAGYPVVIGSPANSSVPWASPEFFRGKFGSS